MVRAGAGLAALAFLFGGVLFGGPPGAADTDDDDVPAGARPAQDDGSWGCLQCHEGIEEMHPEAELSCVDCHGGDATVKNKLLAHVERQGTDPGDERVPPLDSDLAWRRFVNPMDLRIVDRTCGQCHAQEVEYLLTSLHGTTAGHLSDGFYEMGISKKRGSLYGVFPVSKAPREGGAVDRLVQVPAFSPGRNEDQLRTHYADLARKECMQCHLWSEGRAVRGRVGFDGDYRGDGCAACHVEYSIDGLSESRDRSIPRSEPGHPRRHAMTTAPTTATCTSCHYGDASIGLHFRGLSQLPPGAPGGPDIPGTTDAPLNRVFYINDPEMTPPDVHHERGMHCVDCHTLSDVMGDGKLHGQMEHAVEVSCESCHGGLADTASLRTEAGASLEHLRWDADRDELRMTSKVTGKEHVVPQACRVVERDFWEFNADAIESMNDTHANVECYTCHAGWNVNFLGFHFSRNASLTQLDLLSGQRTPGQVTTQEKVFATWKSFYAGLNETGRVAPYLTGFSTMGSVWDEDGELIIDQMMPVTAEGLSGLSMVHHQLHSTRPTARSCVECHRSSATWGMGSPNFRLSRQLAFVADRRGIEVVAVNRQALTASAPLAKIVLPDVVDLVVQCDDLQGFAQYVYATEGGRGVHVIDVSEPTEPKRVAFHATVNPRSLELVGDHLVVADGTGGLRLIDVSKPEEPEEVAQLPMFDAHDVTVQWPWAYVADGPGGLAIVDVRAPIAPVLVAALDLNGASRRPNAASHVATLFQYSRPQASGGEPSDERTRARNLCALIDENDGLVLVDVTEPSHPDVLYPRDRGTSTTRGGGRGAAYRGLALLSWVDVAEAQGGEPTRERDYAYVLSEFGRNGNARLTVIDVTDPRRPRERGEVEAGQQVEMLAPAAFYNPPFLQRMMFHPGENGVLLADASDSAEPTPAGALPGIGRAYVVAVEEFPLDQMIDVDGRRLKDISRDESRWLYRAEIERLLDVSGEALGTVGPFDEPPEMPGATARLHLASLDEDGSGILAGDEYDEAGGEGVDRNEDGRITLIELAYHVGLLTEVRPNGGGRRGRPGMGGMRDEPQFRESRTDPDGDLSRLLDGTNPYEYDRDGDGALDRMEASKAFFDALDLDDDKRVSFDEMSRHPGKLRQIRYRDEGAEELFDSVDKNGDGKVTSREFSIADRDFSAMDTDGDGYVRLYESPEQARRTGRSGRAERVSPFFVERGFVGEVAEWPTRLEGYTALPPVVTADRLFAVLDSNGDDELSRRELSRRDDLWAELVTVPVYYIDDDGEERAELGSESRVLRQQVERRIGQVAAFGVDYTADDFEGRWDLNGDGRVEREELLDVPALVFRGIVDAR